MKVADLIMMRVITLGVMLVCLAFTSTAYDADTRFASGKSALAIPFELEGSAILVQVGVNDSPARAFELDTGSSINILSLPVAKSFGMQLQLGGKANGGVGADTPDFYLVKGKVSFSLPGVVLSNQRLLAMPLDKCDDHPAAIGSDQKVTADQKVEKKTGRAVEGILGKKFFDSFVVEIDYVAR